MAEKLKFEIVTPDGLVVSEEVDEVTAAGSEGEFGVVPGHAPFVTTLKIGMLVAKSDGQVTHYFVNWGYAEVGPDKVAVLADSSEKSGEIDVERAKASKDRAEDRLRKADEVDFVRAEAALERAITRIHVAERRPGG
jgi:F-type H+-transporting ATPase subunit epsilon